MDKLTDKTFQFELVSPEKVLASEPAYMVTVPGEAGDFGVLADHAPVLSSIRPGVVTIITADGATRRLFVSGGFVDVTPSTCSLLAEEAVALDDLNKAELEATLANLRDDLGFAKEDQLKSARLHKQITLTEAKLAAISQAA